MTKGGQENHYVDGYDMTTSNWLRWINCARHVNEENVYCLHCRGKPYYVTSRDIHPGEELLVYYGEIYGNRLDINTRQYDNRSLDISLYKQYACWNIE